MKKAKKQKPAWQPFDDPTMLRISTLDENPVNWNSEEFQSIGNIKNCKLHHHFIIGSN